MRDDLVAFYFLLQNLTTWYFAVHFEKCVSTQEFSLNILAQYTTHFVNECSARQLYHTVAPYKTPLDRLSQSYILLPQEG